MSQTQHASSDQDTAALEISSLSLQTRPTRSTKKAIASSKSAGTDGSSQQIPGNSTEFTDHASKANPTDTAFNAAETGSNNHASNYPTPDQQTLTAEAKHLANLRPSVREGEDYLYMLHSSALA